MNGEKNMIFLLSFYFLFIYFILFFLLFEGRRLRQPQTNCVAPYVKPDRRDMTRRITENSVSLGNEEYPQLRVPFAVCWVICCSVLRSCRICTTVPTSVSFARNVSNSVKNSDKLQQENTWCTSASLATRLVSLYKRQWGAANLH